MFWFDGIYENNKTPKKLDKRSEKLIMLGYTRNGYKLYNPLNNKYSTGPTPQKNGRAAGRLLQTVVDKKHAQGNSKKKKTN